MEKQRRQLTPEQDALKHILGCRDKPFLEERFIDSHKGRGLFTRKAIDPSTFVVEYQGNIFCHKDTTPTKEFGYTLNKYLFEFLWEGAQWCIDASKEDGTLGRLVNDDHISPNCEIKTMVYKGKPHLCLFAVTEISPDEEITYNYGDSAYPWRSGSSCDGSSTSYSDLYATSSRLRTVRSEYSSSSSFQNSCSDNDDKKVPDSGASHANDCFVDINSQMYFRDNSPLADFGSSKKMKGTCMLQPEYASCTQRKHEAASGSDEECRPSKAPSKPKGTSGSKSYCYICGKGVCKVTRHFLRHADEEPEIAKALALPITSKERKTIMNKLRNRGNYQHNQEVLKNNSGELKLKRRPKAKAIVAGAYVHCLHCKGMFSRKEMWKHVARCPTRKTSNTATTGKTRVLGEIALAESPFCEKLPADVWKMLINMKSDEIASAVQNDFLLMQLALYQCNRYGNNPSKHEYIRQQLREMGRLLLALREKSIVSIKDAIRPKNFYKVVEAVKDVTGFNEKMQSYNKPSLALKLGHSLKKMCRIVLTGVDCSDEMMRDTKMFIKMCDREWSQLVSHLALASLRGQRSSNPSTIPFTRDVQALHRYLETTSATAIKGLEKHENQQAYNALCRVTLAQVSVLSKCAPDVSKMTLKTFQQREDCTQVLSKHFIRINIQSRSGQKVAVLVTSELVDAITLLMSKREVCGVHKDNPFLFAKPNLSPTSLFNGANCIRAFSSLCQAKNPEHFRPMHLYKHIARVFQILNLENDELDHLAKLLGHNIRADRDYYRLPQAAVELAKISKLLLAMEKGSLEKFKGNSLEEIEIEDELEPDVEQCNPENQNEDSDLLLQQSDAVEQQGMPLTPEQDAVEHIKAHRDKPFLEMRLTDPFKGRGVFTHESIEASAFVVEYQGNIFSLKETRRQKYGDTLNNYLFDFSWNGTSWRIDATNDDGTLGRLVNDDHISPNCEMKKVVFEGKPHLCLFAVTEISPGEEITYNYGDSAYPWRSGERSEELNATASSPEHEHADDEDYVPTGSGDELTYEQQPIDASCIQQDDESEYSPDDSISDEDIKNPSLTNKNYCYVCGIAQTKISRHLFTHRKEEPDIAGVLKLRKNSKERKWQLEMLRNRGNNMHNQEVLQTRCGELKVRRKTSNALATAKAFVSCLYCKNIYNRKLMWQHMQRCPARKPYKPQSGMTRALALVDAAESTDPQNLSLDVRTMLRTLKKDEISSEVWNDPLLLQLAQCLYSSRERKSSVGVEWIKLQLRNMGRLLLVLKEKSICSIDDAVKLQNFGKLVEAMKELAGFNQETNSYERPNFIKSLEKSLRRIGEINFARAWKANAGNQAMHEADAFIKLCAKEWNYVPPPVSQGNTPTIPLIHDVQLFHQCMEKTATSAVESLTLYGSPPVYSALLRVTVAQVSILNRNMAQVSKATLESFQQRDEAELQEDAAFSKILSKHTVRITLMSNRGQKVSVALTPELLAAITLLVSKRGTCGVHENNPFLFGIPEAPCTSFYHGQRCTLMFVTRCGAKNRKVLRSAHFHKHIARLFQILSLTSDELNQLAKLLGRDIPTDREYYRTPEAACNIAKISVLLSALESGSLEQFEGKSLEEIEIPDKLEPDVEQDNPENVDANEDNGETESSPLMSSSFLVTKRNARVSGKRCRGWRKRQESDDEASELNEDEKNEEVNSERDNWSEDAPPSRAVGTPEGRVSRGNEDATNISFSDGDEDMDVDFDIDGDTDEDVRNEGNEEDGDPSGSAAMPCGAQEEEDSSPSKRLRMTHLNVAVAIDTACSVEEGEKKNKLSSAMTEMKEVKILIPKLDIEKLKAPIHISQLSSECNSIRSPVKDVSIQDDDNQHQMFTKVKDKPSYAKATQMDCSHCKKGMTRGQTAFQKKGFMDVFCSKNCLFEMFPINRTVAKTCHHCLKVISQPLDLIMAAVDIKGTMKNFCSPTCLLFFKSSSRSAQTPRLCSMCNKACTTICQLTLNKAVHTFCSNSCLGNFRRDKVCEHCSSAFYHKPLKLKLKLEEAKTCCSQECLDRFTEKIKTPHQCTMCHTSLPVSDMVHFKSAENVVELFCSSTCATSYMLQLAGGHNLQDCPEKKRATQKIQILAAEKKRDAAERDAMPMLLIAESWVVCGNCGKKMQRGETLHQTKSTLEVFCSDQCLLEKHPNTPPVTKRCYNCFQAIIRPHNMILAPVDDSGAMKELCSATCLASVNSKRNATAHKTPPAAGPRSECRMLGKFCNKMESPQLCLMCQTPHQLSDMVENKNNEGMLDFFCSYRCMLVHNAQSATVSEGNRLSSEEKDLKQVKPSPEENDVKEVKPALQYLDSIKEEPIDEECSQNLPSSISTPDIKDEPKAADDGAKKDLKIGSVFSMTADSSTSPPPADGHLDLPACSNCKRVQMDGETVYQKRGNADVFCSTACLLRFYQMKPEHKTCHYCLQEITQPQVAIQAPVDNMGTMKDFCSQTCLSPFNYMRIVSTKIPLVPVASQAQCSMCSRYCISQHEVIQQDVVHKICSNPCFLRYCTMNTLSICESCRSCCSAPLALKMADGSKKLCNAECLAQFKQKIQTPQPCAMCRATCLMTDMLENKNSKDAVELFCTSSCVMASKIQAVSASGAPLKCDQCGKLTLPACHLAMSDASIRNFCSLTCAMYFKDKQEDVNASTNAAAAAKQSQCDFLNSTEKLPCAQCHRVIKAAPKVIQRKGKINFVCSLACSQEFKTANNIIAKCEYCKNEKILRDAKKVDGKVCFFCSDGCKMLFRQELKKQWGEHCGLCAYCLSISKTRVTAKYKGTNKEFCSEDCSTNHNMLLSRVAQCDTCGGNGKLRQSLPMLGEVKHFCDLRCLLHFCNKKVQMLHPASSPPRSSEIVESSPIITDIVSLASTLAKQPRTSASSTQPVSVPDIQTKVVGHASVQTVPNEVKNKSTLCTPLVHNKGVSCTTQTVSTETQTVNVVPKVIVLPVPVPMYVPLPMNMYSQYIAMPLCLPLPLPVPVFLPNPTVEALLEEERSFKPEMKNVHQREDSVREEGQRRESHASWDHSRLQSDDFDSDLRATFDTQDGSSSDTSFGSLGRPHAHEETPPPALLEMSGDPQCSPGPKPAPSPSQTPAGTVHNKNKVTNRGRGDLERQQAPRAAAEEEVVSKKPHNLKSQCGVDAWKRWIQWREMQTNLISSAAPALHEDVLRCSASERSNGLCCFITEAKRPDGEPYSPDTLFYLCLGIQQYLFDNGRQENIFSDPTYSKFSTKFTSILKSFKPSATDGCYIHSRVEEGFLWDCKQLGAYSPIVLLNTLLFFCCKYFGFTTVEQHRQLSFAHVMRCTKTNPNNTKTTFLRFYPPITISDAETDADRVPAKKRKRDERKEDILELMENMENPLRCPVRHYEFYLSKCAESVRQRTDLFYLLPDRRCVPNSPLWFSSTPLDDGTMEGMLVRILAVRELRGPAGVAVHQQTSGGTLFVPEEEEE